MTSYRKWPMPKALRSLATVSNAHIADFHLAPSTRPLEAGSLMMYGDLKWRKRAQTQQREPMRMLLPRHHLPRALVLALNTTAAHA